MIHSVYSLLEKDNQRFDRYHGNFSAALSSDYLRRGFIIVPEKNKSKSYTVVSHDMFSAHFPGCSFYTLSPLRGRMEESDFTRMNNFFVFDSKESYEIWEEWRDEAFHPADEWRKQCANKGWSEMDMEEK